ncbi:unnamed protein product [Sympodiomycopsis kandeliae]
MPAKQQDGKVEPPKTGWNGPIPSKEGGSGEPEYMFKPPYFWHSDEFQVKWTSSCWCGKVKFEYAGDPIDAKHCHCTQCQRLHGAPFQYAALFHKTSVRMHKGCDPTFLDFYSTHRKHSEHDVPVKVSCTRCRSPLMDEGRNMIMAYPSSFNFPDGKVPSPFAPSCHIFYKEAIIEIDDGVPKWSGHKDISELLPHSSHSHGKLGHGKSGKEKRGELHPQDDNHVETEGAEDQKKVDSEGVKEKEEVEHDDDSFYSSDPKADDGDSTKAAGHHKKRRFPNGQAA